MIQAKEIGTFPPARQFNPEVPDRLDLIIAKMTAKQPKHRYQSCKEVIEDLESLELASPVLTFVRQTELRMEEETPPPVPGDVPPASRSISAPTTNEWYVRLKTSDGDMVIKKFSTSQIFKMIDSGQLSPNTKASRTEEGGFRSVATFKEFESVALALATRSNIDKQTTKYREIYKQIEEEDLLHREKKKQKGDELDDSIKNALRGTLIIGGCIVGGIIFLWFVITIIRFFFG